MPKTKVKAKTPAKPRRSGSVSDVTTEPQFGQVKGNRKATPVPHPALVEQPHGGALMAGGQGQGGRPKDVWRARVRTALDEANGVEFLISVVKGEAKEETVDGEGTVVQTQPKIRDRIVAANILIEQAHGKPPQEVTLEDERPRPTGEQIMARILELLPKVIPALPVDRKEIARLLAERKRIEVLVQGKVVNR